MSRLALVDADGVAIGVADKGHVADGGLQRADFEGHIGGAQFSDGSIKVIHFQTDTATLVARVPARDATNGHVPPVMSYSIQCPLSVA